MNTVGQHQRQFYRFIQLLLLMLTTTQTASGSGIVTAPTAPFGQTEYTSFSFNAPCSRYTNPVTGSVSEQPFASISLLLACLNHYPVYALCPTTPCYAMSVMNPSPYTSYPSTWYRTWCGYQYCATGQAKPSCPAGYSLPSLPFPQQANVCVANSMANASCNLGLTCICNPGFAPDASARSCVLQCQQGQQPNAAGTACVTPPPSTCPAGQVPHKWGGCMLACPADQHPNLADTACVANDACTVAHLTPLPIAASDPCTAALESHSSQAIVDKACGIPSPNMQKEVACLAEKLAANGITISINNKVRSEAYQAHFWDVWSKMIDVMDKNIQNDPLKKAACAARRTELANEKGCDHEKACLKKKKPYCPLGGHCFASRPSQNPKSAHSERRAIDMSGLQVNALEALLQGQTPPKSIKQFLAEPSKATGTTCPAVPLLRWGGDFVNEPPDRVHFYLDKP